MNRLDKYYKLLGNIYGERIVKKFTTKNENSQTLEMNDIANNQKEKKNYYRKDGEGCKICKDKFRNENNINFFKRILEFPGWIGYLNFAGTAPAKEIMIIGEAPTTLKDQINIAFGLGLYPIDSYGKLDFEQLKQTYVGEKKLLDKIKTNQTSKNKLWEYLNLLFSGKLNDIKSKIYITDLCKCNDDIKKEFTKDNKIRYKLDKNEEMWKKCLTECLIKEIELINPSLIIFQGGKSYKFVMRYLKSKGLIKSITSIIEKTEDYYPKLGEPDFYEKSYSRPCFGKFPFKGKHMYFFKIYHQAAFNLGFLNISDRNNYIKQNNQFIEKKILKEVLNIN